MIFAGLLLLFVVFVIALFVVDYFRRTPRPEKIPLTFIVPCYNDADTVADTIDSIYASYPHDYIALVVSNDASTDTSDGVISQKQRQYGFVYHKNEKNLGKVQTINNAIDQVQTRYFMIVDADTCLSEAAIDDMLSRLQHNNNVAAVSCYYKPVNRGFFPWMQGIEYHMLALIQGAYNIWSTISLWGGCIMINTKICRDLGKFSITAIVEDMDMAFRLNLHGYRVEQSHIGVQTHVPDTLKTWFKQKLRRNS